MRLSSCKGASSFTLKLHDMKKLFGTVLMLIAIFAFSVASAQFSKLKQKIADKVSQRADQKTDKAIDNSLDSVDAATKAKNKQKSTTTSGSTQSQSSDNTAQAATGAAATQAAPSIKAYQNYDFVPGDKILFEDHFTDDQDAEFPSHWELEKGQAQLNKANGELAFFLTEGNYVEVYPRMKTDKYLTDPFTVEFDYYNKDNAYGIVTFLKRLDKACDCETNANLEVGASEVSFDGSVSFSKSYSIEMQGENF